MNPFRMEEGNLNEAVLLLHSIPEFVNAPDRQAIESRIANVPHLILTAHTETTIIGCKIGYEREGAFYSWLGAVKPGNRQSGIASKLAEYQETWAKEKGYARIQMKTRNCFPEMLIMAMRRGFRITGMDIREEITQNRILLEKTL